MEPIITAENLSKRYRIGTHEAPYKTLRETLAKAISNPFKRPQRNRHSDEGIVWALKNVSFEVRQGEIVGIIGRNGSGKSTLLKVLSRITEPTTGRVKLRGRIRSLLEVGTGFHPELTGRENIYLNGAILGMGRIEINRKFDEIVAFSEVEKFIDTPVKYYSSGMYLRLAFAIAVHLEPEILIVDEVLAVGDTAFQKKSLNKMEDVGQQGRTILFVSHDMSAITRLCQRAVLLDSGKVLEDGPSQQVVSDYLSSELGTTAAREWPDLSQAPGNETVRLRAVRVRTEEGHITDVVDIRKPVGIEVEYQVLKSGSVLFPNVYFHNEEGICVFVSTDYNPAWRGKPRPEGHYTSTAWVPGNFLAEGTLLVGAGVSTIEPPTAHVFEREAIGFQVIDSFEGDSARGDWPGSVPGVVRPLLRWATQFSPNAQDSFSGENHI